MLVLITVRAAFPAAFTAMAMPFWRAGSAVTNSVGERSSLSSRASYMAAAEDLQRENEALRAQGAILAARAADLERLLGGRAEAAAGIPAGVLARPPVSPYDFLVVDRGSDSGLVPGAMAFGPGGIPIGTVADAAASTARISLYSTTGRATEGWAGAARVPLTLIGTGAGSFDTEIVAAAGLVVGDPVFAPGPGALPIGTVTAVVIDPSSPTVTLRIRGLTNPFSLTWVTVSPIALP